MSDGLGRPDQKERLQLRPIESVGLIEIAGSDSPSQTFEQRLSLAATKLLKIMRRLLRGSARSTATSISQWADWLVDGVLFFVVALLAPLIDRGLFRAWRERGLRGLWVSFALGAAVYVRLVIDGRTPILGKGLLAFALVYGVATHDLFPDWVVPLGILDDLIVVVLAGRCFMRLCPDQLVQEHAIKAARARERTLRSRRPRSRGVLPLR